MLHPHVGTALEVEDEFTQSWAALKNPSSGSVLTPVT
jgi:hypothetical protein